MATTAAIAGTCEAIVRLLRASYNPADFNGAALDFQVYVADDFNHPMDEGVSVFLYRIYQNGNRARPTAVPAPRNAANSIQSAPGPFPHALWYAECFYGPRPDMNPDRTEDCAPIREGKYTNCFQIGYNAFEFLLEFGQSYVDETDFMHTRLVTTPQSAARLSQLLSDAVTQYEARFGPISLEGEPK